MANNYLQFSFQIEVTEQTADFAKDLLVQLGDCADGDHEGVEFDEWVESFCAEFEDMIEIDMVVEKLHPLGQRPGDIYGLWFKSEESGNVEATARFVQRLMEEDDSITPVGFTYAYTCSKMRLDEFGGGGVVVTAEEVYYKDSSEWCRSVLDGLKLGRKPE